MTLIRVMFSLMCLSQMLFIYPPDMEAVFCSTHYCGQNLVTADCKGRTTRSDFTSKTKVCQLLEISKRNEKLELSSYDCVTGLDYISTKQGSSKNVLALTALKEMSVKAGKH
ncbi:hypothetical protein AMECASPLE_007048 [Ameca splendens]|uniref:Secreted protein n=1 Tax=Ameca splendens TaxID=208324 RepID=A0ABV0ZAL9_9TELE